MKKTFLRHSARILSLLLMISLLVCSFAACANQGKTLMKLEKDGIKVTLSVNLYELFLCRMKGVLYNGGYTNNGVGPESQAFWNYTSKFEGDTVMTLDQYYHQNILTNCRTYLVSLYLFEQMDLQLTNADLEDVQQRLDELVRTDGGGSKTKLNSYLAGFGVNYNMLKDAYLLEKKVTAVQNALFGENAGLIGDDIKTDHMKENYVHFRQIFLPTYNYKTETDANGDTVYYYTEGSMRDHVYYDTHNGVVGYNEDGSVIKDKNGDTVYFVNDGEYKTIAYNKANGSPSYLMVENSTQYQIVEMTEEEKKALEARANALTEELTGKSYEEFEIAIGKEITPQNDLEQHPDGYYIDRNVDFAASGSDSAYLSEIIEKLDQMQDGDVALVPSPYGYHVIKKYPFTEKAYSLPANETWFENFNSNLIEKLFLERCETYFPEIYVDEKVLAGAPSIKNVAINYNLI
ncbi:MAG: hypothetical protein IKC31_00585 [Clostridia bacterium]|nr:hypothetical protein [Clostridia bacterium]